MIGELKARSRKPAVDRDPRIREGEQRNYHVASPRMVSSCSRSFGGIADLSSFARGALQFGRRWLAELPKAIASARDRTSSPGGGVCQEAHREPTTTGSTPDSSSATQVATPSTA